jgi:hypothetical protein
MPCAPVAPVAPVAMPCAPIAPPCTALHPLRTYSTYSTALHCAALPCAPIALPCTALRTYSTALHCAVPPCTPCAALLSLSSCAGHRHPVHVPQHQAQQRPPGSGNGGFAPGSCSVRCPGSPCQRRHRPHRPPSPGGRVCAGFEAQGRCVCHRRPPRNNSADADRYAGAGGRGKHLVSLPLLTTPLLAATTPLLAACGSCLLFTHAPLHAACCLLLFTRAPMHAACCLLLFTRAHPLLFWHALTLPCPLLPRPCHRSRSMNSCTERTSSSTMQGSSSITPRASSTTPRTSSRTPKANCTMPTTRSTG